MRAPPEAAAGDDDATRQKKELWKTWWFEARNANALDVLSKMPDAKIDAKTSSRIDPKATQAWVPGGYTAVTLAATPAVDADVALPRCACGAAVRPNVSHETDVDDELCATVKAAQRAHMVAWLDGEKRRRSALVVLEVGCGTSVHSLRADSELAVASHRAAGGAATLVRVDPGDCRVPAGPDHLGLALGARDALARLVDD